MISGVALEERTTTFKIESDVVTEGIIIFKTWCRIQPYKRVQFFSWHPQLGII